MRSPASPIFCIGGRRKNDRRARRSKNCRAAGSKRSHPGLASADEVWREWGRRSCLLGGTELAQCLPPGSTRDASRICGRRRANSNRRRSQRPRPCDPRSPLTRLRRFLASRTEGSTDCATLRRRERSSAPGVAPVANEMWLQPRRRCRRSGEMWSHLTPTGPAKPVSATGRQRTADAILTSMIAMGTEPWSTNMRRPVRR